jgi:hypothetical protein
MIEIKFTDNALKWGIYKDGVLQESGFSSRYAAVKYAGEHYNTIKRIGQ